MSILFNLYKLPYGKKEHVMIDLKPEIETKAHELADRGMVFEVETLRTGVVSITCEHHGQSTDQPVLSHVLTLNLPTEITKAVETVVIRAHEVYTAQPEKYPQLATNWRAELKALIEARQAISTDWKLS